MSSERIQLVDLSDLLQEVRKQVGQNEATIFTVPRSTLWIVYQDKKTYDANPWFVRAWSRRGTIQLLGFFEIVRELIARDVNYSRMQPLMAIRLPEDKCEIELCAYRGGTLEQYHFAIVSCC